LLSIFELLLPTFLEKLPGGVSMFEAIKKALGKIDDIFVVGFGVILGMVGFEYGVKGFLMKKLRK